MKSMRLMGMVALVMLLSASMAAATMVTFQVDMNVQTQLGFFDPAVDSVGVLGDHNGWNGNDDWGVCADDDEDGIYTTTYDLDSGFTGGYKFVYYTGGVPGQEITWEGVDNRPLDVGDDDLVLDVVFFNDENSANPQFDYEMIFQVDMSVAIQTGVFDADNDAVIIRGGNAAIGNWGGYIALVREGATDIYTALIELDALQTGIALEWKYVIDVDNDQSDPVIWEELPQGGNRMYTPSGDEPDTDDNGRLEVTNEIVFWADNPGGIDNDLTLTFTLDGRPALRKHADVGIPGIDGEIDFFIVTGPWDGTGWLWTNGELSNNNLFDDGVAPDAVAGDSIYTCEVFFPAGTGINLTYKYGANGYDNEGGIGTNWFTELNADGGTQTVADQFGEIGTDYDDYLFVIERPVASLPTKFVVEQNYPNPFNPTTNINFTLPAPGETMLRVFNITGQQVMAQNMGNMNAGAYQIQLDASSLSSGVYFYRIESNGLSATKKMLLTK